jgi:hypothetical protein
MLAMWWIKPSISTEPFMYILATNYKEVCRVQIFLEVLLFASYVKWNKGQTKDQLVYVL